MIIILRCVQMPHTLYYQVPFERREYHAMQISKLRVNIVILLHCKV